MSQHSDIDVAAIRGYWARAVAEFERWGWKRMAGDKGAHDVVIYERDLGKKATRVYKGGSRVVVTLGRGIRWECPVCKTLPNMGRVSLHWTNWGRVALHMILHHEARRRK